MGRWRFTKICFLTGAVMSAGRLVASLLFGDDIPKEALVPAILIPLVMLAFGFILDLILARRRRRAGGPGRRSS